jgi:hypothetical protein
VQAARLLQLQDSARDGNTERRPWNRENRNSDSTRTHGTEKPSHGTEKPGHGTEKPGHGAEKPGHGTEKTGHGNRVLITCGNLLECISDIIEAWIGIMEIRIKILGHGNMVPGTQKRFHEQEVWIPEQGFRNCCFWKTKTWMIMEKEMAFSIKEYPSLGQGSRIKTWITEHSHQILVHVKLDYGKTMKTRILEY